MALLVEQDRTATQNGRRDDRGFEHLAAPVLSLALEVIAFPPHCRKIAELHKTTPDIFRGITHSDGTNLPNAKTVLMYALLEQAA